MRPPNPVVHTCPDPTSGPALFCYFSRSSYTAIRIVPSRWKRRRCSSGCEHGHKHFPSPRNQSPIVAAAGLPFGASTSAPSNQRQGNCIGGDLTSDDQYTKRPFGRWKVTVLVNRPHNDYFAQA